MQLAAQANGSCVALLAVGIQPHRWGGDMRTYTQHTYSHVTQTAQQWARGGDLHTLRRQEITPQIQIQDVLLCGQTTAPSSLERSVPTL